MQRRAAVALVFLVACDGRPPTPPSDDDVPPVIVEPIPPIDVPPPIDVDCEGGPTAVLAPIEGPVHMLDVVYLDGSDSLASDGSTFVGVMEFTLLQRPPGSNASLTGPMFELDAVGRYRVQLHVYDVYEGGSARSCEPAELVIDAGPLDDDLVAVLTWDHPTADLDLHTLRENGEPFTHEGDVYFSNREPIGAPWSDDPDENPVLDVDDDEGYGPERTTLKRAIVDDTWTFAVHYWNQQTDGDAQTNARLRIVARSEVVFDETIAFVEEQLFWAALEVTWTEEAPEVRVVDSIRNFPRPF